MVQKIWGLSKKAVRSGRPDPRGCLLRLQFMFPPLGLGGCRLVRGVIRASATCDEFAARCPTA